MRERWRFQRAQLMTKVSDYNYNYFYCVNDATGFVNGRSRGNHKDTPKSGGRLAGLALSHVLWSWCWRQGWGSSIDAVEVRMRQIGKTQGRTQMFVPHYQIARKRSWHYGFVFTFYKKAPKKGWRLGCEWSVKSGDGLHDLSYHAINVVLAIRSSFGYVLNPKCFTRNSTWLFESTSISYLAEWNECIHQACRHSVICYWR